MTTERINVRVAAPGAKQSAQDLAAVRQGVAGVGRSAVGILPSLGAAGLLTGLLGGSLIGLAASTGAASNAGIRLTSVLEDLIETLLEPLLPALDWFSELDEGMQAAIISAGALAGVFRGKLLGAVRALGPAGAALFVIGAGLAYAYKNSETFQAFVDGALKGAMDGLRDIGANILADWQAIQKVWDGLDRPDWLDDALSAFDAPFGASPGESGAALGESIVKGSLPNLIYEFFRNAFRDERGIGAGFHSALFPPAYNLPAGTTPEQFDDPSFRERYEVPNPLLLIPPAIGAAAAGASAVLPNVYNYWFGASPSAVEDAARAAQNDPANRFRGEGY